MGGVSKYLYSPTSTYFNDNDISRIPPPRDALFHHGFWSYTTLPATDGA